MELNRIIEVKHLGVIDYMAALAMQEAYCHSIAQSKRKNKNMAASQSTPSANYLLFCEHPPTYTLGRNGSMEHLLIDSATLKAQSIALYETNRGGDITYHGPGQLVVYPIIDLENFFTDIHRYLRLLEEVVIETLADFNIASTQSPDLTGVWLQGESRQGRYERKICAIGIRVSRWITMHGLALNVNNDLSPFGQIIPCGLDKAVTSMQEEIKKPICIKAVSSVLEKIILTKLYCS